MAYSESPFSSTSSSSRHRWSYDVFLSFRGQDTRNNFIDHLSSALEQAGIHTFWDDNELVRGEEISPQLLRAIEGSRISVVVFSRNYASSRCCLDELVKIMECRQKTHRVVLPIFYDTDPSDVRKQTGSYAKAFDEHEKNFKEEMEKVNRWREALTQVANLSGRVLHNKTNGYEAELIKTIVNDVASKLGNKTGIEMTRLKSGWTDAISASEQEQNNVDMAQQREPLLTGEFERANDLTGAGIELPRDTPDDQDELKKLKGSKSRDMLDDFESGWTDAISASEQEKNNVEMAQQREPLFTEEFERANDLTGARIELPPDTSDDQEPLFLALDSVHHVDRIVPPTIDENYNRREATERLVQPGVGASSFGVYGNHNAISTSQQEQNNDVDNVAGDAGTTPAAETMAHAPGRSVEEYMSWLMEDGEDEELLVGKGLSKDAKARKLALQHWLQAIDPRHRYGHNLQFYFVNWIHCQSTQPFFYWLDIGSGKEVNLDTCPRSKLRTTFQMEGVPPSSMDDDVNQLDLQAQEDNFNILAVDEGTTPAAATRDHTPGRYFEEFSRWSMEDDEDEEPGEDEELLEQRRKGIEMVGSNSFSTICGLAPKQVQEAAFLTVLSSNYTHKTMRQRRKGIEIIRLKSGWTDVVSPYAREQNNVDMAQLRETLFLALDSVHHVDRIVPPTIDENYIQVLGQSNVELDNFSVGAERTQVEEEEDTLNNSGRVAQPGAGASSSGGLRHNPSETRGAPCSTKLGGRAFEENKNVILSWLKDDKVSIIGIYGMPGAGKTTLLKHICNERSPDICYPVYWVTLSPDFSIHKLQNKIAESIQLSFSNEEEELGLRAEKLSQKPMQKQRCWKEEKLGRRAKELSQELMKKQRWILILDNLCNSFKLDEVGIPLSLKGCKLIMITRSDVVCRQMNSRNNVRVNPLSTEESLTLWYLQGGFLCCQGQGRKSIEMARLKSGWTSLMTNLILEIASAVFDQLGYALVGMVLAFVALLLSTAERMNLLPSFLLPRKERTSLLPSFHRQSASTFAPGNPVGTIVEYFGLVGGVWQCFYSTVEYSYDRQKRDNPIKMCLLPFLFLSCVVISILIKKSYIDKRA